ncbi:DUF3995 domain-containing protein [Microbacterium xanthum]|uniref:DUF3995 domain-containing protein n=1 Tax=Microbacterium xanthum TaxID=3079794 RepID=UPI002AD334BF|nr:DUF3995 domain-containing protein [Microbacterium sp. KSW-48]MDZ8173102.1 DUF3995 domain-containing protein [Microbacterium sp. KSW-48]
MSIRNRTEKVRTSAGLLGAAVVGAAGLVHAAWAAGSTWPADSPDELADLVVGTRPMPGAPACTAVAALLGAASIATTLATVGGQGPIGRLTRRGSTFAAGVLVVRGVGGLAVEALNVGDVAPEFRRWNRRLYSPLCIALGVLIGLGAGAEAQR